MVSVLRCIFSLSRAVQRTVPSFPGPYIDVASSVPAQVPVVTSDSNYGTSSESSITQNISTMNISTTSTTNQPSPPPPKSTTASVPPPIPSSSFGKSTQASPANSTTASNVTTHHTSSQPSQSTTPSKNIPSSIQSSSSQPIGTRGAGFGLDAELAKKQAAKYDHAAEADCISWIETVTGESFAGNTFAGKLKSGEVLCKLINCIKPNQIAKINASTMPFKQMENITSFLRACRTLGVSEHDLFETVDLYEEKDLNVVILCIFALGRTIQVTVPTYTGPVLGPRMAVANKREFTEDQLLKGNACETKIMAGSRGVMDRTHVTVTGVTFGADSVGTGDSSSTSKQNIGSSTTMSRTEIQTSNSVTFGHDMANR
jgi:hypothetical protein